MANKKTVKFEARWTTDYGSEFVRRIQHNGDTCRSQYFLRDGSGWFSTGYVDETPSLNWDRQRNWEVQRFTPIKGIKTFGKKHP